MTGYEWATLNPANGVPIQWDTEAEARAACASSATFPGGPHGLARRKVGPWLPVALPMSGWVAGSTHAVRHAASEGFALCGAPLKGVDFEGDAELRECRRCQLILGTRHDTGERSSE